MTSVPLHPALVHVPLGLVVVVPLLAAAIALGLWRGWFTRRAFLVLAMVQALLVGAGVLALKSGEREEKVVERIVGERALHAHEEAAQVFVWGAVAVLVLAAGATALPGRAGHALSLLTVVAALAVALLGYRAGKAGGELVYARGAALAYGPATATPPRPIAAKHHGDDD